MKTQLINLFIFICIFTSSYALYEDQVGKFEWRQRYIGKVKHLHLDIISPYKKIIVTTEQNVVAALSLKSGDIIWRQILEQGKEGVPQALSVDSEVVTVSGTRSPLVRGWDLENGHSLFEWAPTGILPGLPTHWIIQEDYLVTLQLGHGEIFVRWYGLRYGDSLGTQRLGVDPLESASCVASGSYLSCLDAEGVLTNVIVKGVGEAEATSVPVAEKIGDATELNVLDGRLPAIVAKGSKASVILLLPEAQVLPVEVPYDAVVSSVAADDLDYILVSQLLAGKLVMKAYSLEGEEVRDLSGSTPWSSNTGLPSSASASCQVRRDRTVACRLAVVTADHALVTIQHPGPILWTREEALASILAVELVELPVSETDAAIDSEFSNKNDGFVGMLCRRLGSQWSQLQGLLAAVLGVQGSNTGKAQGLVRDEFGLHKLIVAVTEAGKVFGIDNLSGEIVWSVLADISPLKAALSPSFVIYVLRTAVHPPHPAKLAILGQTDGKSSILTLNPITGETETLRKLPFIVRQTLSLHLSDETHLKPFLLLDDQKNVHVHPESAIDVAVRAAANTYAYTVDTNTGLMEGLKLRVSGNTITAVRSWLARLGEDDARVVAVAGKRDGERVHSQGRVFSDRSVLYKYANPNLVAIFTQGYHVSHKYILNLYLVDVVSGAVVYSTSHKRAREPVHVVHSENWLVYAWTSEKYRRTEMAAIELHEGVSQSNASVFTSFATPPLIPAVETQAYILPANILALRDTVTEKGITNKHIMVALANGGILELPYAYLDPRRTIAVTPEMREEGVVPYIPELPIPLEAIVNYNQTIANVREIHTAPSGIESTSLLFVYGLDIFYTRVAPSKTFDLLKEDFDYYLISLVLAGLIIASFVTRRLSSRKALKQAWK